jgi:hypothetical protein
MLKEKSLSENFFILSFLWSWRPSSLTAKNVIVVEMLFLSIKIDEMVKLVVKFFVTKLLEYKHNYNITVSDFFLSFTLRLVEQFMRLFHHTYNLIIQSLIEQTKILDTVSSVIEFPFMRFKPHANCLIIKKVSPTRIIRSVINRLFSLRPLRFPLNYCITRKYHTKGGDTMQSHIL